MYLSDIIILIRLSSIFAMERKDNLQDITSRIGAMRVARYCVAMLDTTTVYLRSVAGGYTERRERISVHKLNEWLFGTIARTGFTHNPNIKYFADVDDVDAKALHIALENAETTNYGREKTQGNIMTVFSTCKIVCAYLMSNMKDESIKSPRPYQNPFEKFIFRNSRDYVKNTPVIPERVMEQLEIHIGELQDVYQLLFKIFSNTGMRAKEVLFLEADCIEKSKYKNYVLLKYKPYKVLSARRKVGVGDYHRVLISCSLANEIERENEACRA